MIDYTPLWKTMEEKHISQYHLLKNGIDNKTLDSLKKNKNITMLTMEKLCKIIGCTPNDVVQFKYRQLRSLYAVAFSCSPPKNDHPFPGGHSHVQIFSSSQSIISSLPSSVMGNSFFSSISESS